MLVVDHHALAERKPAWHVFEQLPPKARARRRAPLARPIGDVRERQLRVDSGSWTATGDNRAGWRPWPTNSRHRPPLPLAIISFRVIEFARPFQRNVPLRPVGQLIRFHRRVMN
jgi:hypothetical protein